MGVDLYRYPDTRRLHRLLTHSLNAMNRLVRLSFLVVWLLGALLAGVFVPPVERSSAPQQVVRTDGAALAVHDDQVVLTVGLSESTRWRIAVPTPSFLLGARRGCLPPQPTVHKVSDRSTAPRECNLHPPLTDRTPAPVIQLRNITKAYRNGLSRTFVLRQIDLDIDEGEFVTIQGPSGAGKTTLLHILGLLDAPTEGTYEFMGEPVHEMSENRRTEIHRSQIGFVFQAYHLIDDLTVYENLETPLIYKGLSGSERESKVADLLDRFSLVAKQDLFPNQLSGGQQQLVGVARALIIEPTVILADEPTGNLQSRQSEEIMATLKRLNDKEDVTVVQVTHSEKQAAYGDRIIELEDGWIVDDYPVAAKEAAV